MVKIATIDTDYLPDAVTRTISTDNEHWAEDASKFEWCHPKCKITDDDSFHLDYFRSTAPGDILVKDGISYGIDCDLNVIFLDAVN